jgi:hypothetical protein
MAVLLAELFVVLQDLLAELQPRLVDRVVVVLGERPRWLLLAGCRASHWGRDGRQRVVDSEGRRVEVAHGDCGRRFGRVQHLPDVLVRVGRQGCFIVCHGGNGELRVFRKTTGSTAELSSCQRTKNTRPLAVGAWAKRDTAEYGSLVHYPSPWYSEVT